MNETCEQLTGHPMDHGWRPHKPETWAYRYATLRNPLTMRHFMGHDKPDHEVPMIVGSRVKIVMVSRLGDVGITEDLTAENGYGARVMLDDLRDFGVAP